ncbi:MerR family DNA-binding protein [Cohnella ginsengisoli]|uniref:MerR family DNA-binding protein n=1 Tax=Cohnella ginsengisoli TaxID=425004 RepID=UPI003B8A6BDD
MQSILFLTRLKATGMTIEEMKRYRELSSRGNDAIPEKMSILEHHKQKIQNEISRLMEVQKIIEYKLDHYQEIVQDPDLNDTGCTPTLLDRKGNHLYLIDISENVDIMGGWIQLSCSRHCLMSRGCRFYSGSRSPKNILCPMKEWI